MLTTCFYHSWSLLKTKGDLDLVTLNYFLHDYWRKIFLMLYSINWANFIVWLHLRLQILGNMCIVIISCPVCDVINFEIKLNFLIKSFSYIAKKSGWKLIFLENKKSFQHEIKLIKIIKNTNFKNNKNKIIIIIIIINKIK